MPQVKLSRLLRYGFAVLIVALAATITWMFPLLGSRIPFALFYAAVMLSAWYGGRGPGLLAIALSALLSAYLFLPPNYTLAIGAEGVLLLGVFILVSLVIGSLTEKVKRAEIKARTSQEQLLITLKSIGDAVIATDAQSRVTFLNGIAQELTGCKLEEAQGKDLREVFKIINQKTRNEVESPVAKVIREGAIVGLANHTILIAKDGREIPIDDSGAPIRDAEGNIMGVVLVFRDIAQQRHAEELRNRLASIVESSEDAVISKTLDGVITSWNAGAENLYGYGAEEVIGSSIAILVPADLPDELPSILERLKRGERIRHFETKRVRKDGRVLDIALTISPINDAEGTIIGASTIARDITEQKRARAALSESEERYRAFVGNSSEAIWRFELEEPVSVDLPTDEQIEHCYKHGFLGECNDAMAEMYGFEHAEEIVGARLDDFLLRDDPQNVEYLRAFINSGYRLTEAESHEADKEGQPKYFLNNLVGIIEGGKLIRAWGTQRDITKRKTAEDALRASEARFRRVVESNLIGVSFASIDGEITDANDAYLRMLGRTREELQAGLLRWDNTTPPEHHHLDERAIKEIRATGACAPFEKEHIRKDGTRVPVLIGSALLDESGENCVCFIVDLTEQKRAEKEREQLLAREKAARIEAENANRTKDEFLATLSHELRTPLTAMLGWTRMLRMRELDETTAAHALETVERNAKAQAQLIEDLLDVSRIITGNLRLDVRPVELLPVIEAAIDAAQPAADAKGIQLHSFLDPLAGPVSGDPARLQQVVWNLLSNAVKFTKGGEVRVRLERVNSHIEITVSDTGQGISREFLPYVFDRFRQADSSTTRVHGGLGLGLAIVRHLVELHGGTVQAESEGLGRGATFKVKLPVMALRIADFGFRNEETASEESVGPSPLVPILSGLRLLVVDDERDARELMRTVLEKQGASVTTVGSAREALEALEREKPDLLISDIGMPDQDGYDLIRSLRARPEADGGKIPAAAVSAYVGEENRRQALAAGFQIHVAKPLDPSELIAVVQSLVMKSNGEG